MSVGVPKCWACLLEIQDLAGAVAQADRQIPADDPHPYRDDERVVSALSPDGNQVDVSLRSGERNYWVEICIYDPDGGLVVCSEPIDELHEGRHDVDGYSISLTFI